MSIFENNFKSFENFRENIPLVISDLLYLWLWQKFQFRK